MERLFRSLNKRIFWRMHLRSAALSLAEKTKALEDHVIGPYEIASTFKGVGYFESLDLKQNQSEIIRCLKFIAELNPNKILEIGSHKGGTLYLWCQLLQSTGLAVSVDLPGGDFGGGLPPGGERFFESFCQSGQKLVCFRRDSHSEETKNQVASVLDGEFFDFCFIDGDHTYDGVARDFDLYSPLVRAGGWIGFHDILPRANNPKIEVWKFWQEIKASGSEYLEFIGDDGGRQIGIGLVKI